MPQKEKRPIINVGYQCGHLTVIARTQEQKSGYSVWECQCTCGNKVFLDTRYLQRGTIRDCGCITKVKPGTKNIAGARYGKLVCLEQTEHRIRGDIAWRCKCDCGNEVLVPVKQLTCGYVKSCGCLGHPPLKDFIGKRFGKLTVIEYAGKRAGMHRWKCMCDCGKETIVGQTLLQTGKTKSCGCLQTGIIKNNLKFFDGTSITVLEATHTRLLSNNTSGYNGVYRNKKTGKWVAQITFKGKTHYLGSYGKIEDAVKARLRAEEMYDEVLEAYYQLNND